MKDIVLYCKSYSKDFLRLKRLLDSIAEFNRDQIPFYISTPAADHALLLELLGDQGYVWISDESILQSNPLAPSGVEKGKSGGLVQQVIKSEFWRLGLCENYLCLDSDCIFIQDFRRSDFLAADGNPYTVIYQNKEYFQLAIDRGFARAPKELKAEGDRVKALFSRQGPNYYCPCPPFIWSTAVWKSLDEQFLRPRGLTFWDVCTPENPETLLYLEALLNFKAIPLYPIEQLMRIYYYDWQYFFLKRAGERENNLKTNYLGVIYQSNWDSDLDYEPPAKSLPSRLLRKAKRLARYLQSYF